MAGPTTTALWHLAGASLLTVTLQCLGSTLEDRNSEFSRILAKMEIDALGAFGLDDLALGQWMTLASLWDSPERIGQVGASDLKKAKTGCH